MLVNDQELDVVRPISLMVAELVQDNNFLPYLNEGENSIIKKNVKKQSSVHLLIVRCFIVGMQLLLLRTMNILYYISNVL